MTGAAAALAASPAADSGSEFPGVLDGVLLAGPAARLAAMLDQAFLAGAGWDPGSRVLSLPAGHPLLGRVVCRAGGCDATAHGTKTGGLCWRCFARLTRAGLSAGEITSSPELPPLPDRPPGCAVPGCLRMSPGGRQGQRTGLCQAHSRRFRRVPGMTMERFLADPRVRPLPALGPCNVAACARRAESGHGYCPTHYVRWRQAVTACPGAEERHWQLTEPAVSEGGRVSLRGLPPLVVTEVLFGIWQRTGDGAKITDVNLRAVCDALRRQQAGSIGACAPERVPGKPTRNLLAAMARQVRRALADPGSERAADTWDLAIFGHAGRLSFTGITQPWLREAASTPGGQSTSSEVPPTAPSDGPPQPGAPTPPNPPGTQSNGRVVPVTGSAPARWPVTRKPSQAAATPTATPITVSARRSIGCCQGCCGLTAEATKTTAVVIAAVAASPGRPIR